jgi:hypothetical protein
MSLLHKGGRLRRVKVGFKLRSAGRQVARCLKGENRRRQRKERKGGGAQ